MRIPSLRLAVGVLAATAAAVLAAPAHADIVGIAVLNTGSEGPVLGCPHSAGAGISRPTDGTFEVLVDGVALTPVRMDFATEVVDATWTPDRFGWHTIEVLQHKPDGTTASGRLDIEVRRAGINAGSSCIANGVPLPIDPKTGTLAPYR